MGEATVPVRRSCQEAPRARRPWWRAGTSWPWRARPRACRSTARRGPPARPGWHRCTPRVGAGAQFQNP
eukprot:2704346-Alexandrium_andersonii.AAC.1